MATLAVGASIWAAPSAWGQPPPDPRQTHCVLRLPGTDAVRVRTNLPFRRVGDRTLGFDLYSPPPGAPALGGPLPTVVFVNGVGDRQAADAAPLKEWGIYRDWARLVAVSGMAAVVHNATSDGAAADLAALFEYLRAHAAELGIDGDNLSLWACSANVHIGFPYAMEPAREFLKCAVIYYGNVDPALLRYDLPLMLVRAGLDTPLINNSIDAYAQRALPANVPLTVVNLPNAIHAFDAFEDNDQSREMVKATLAFLAENLSPGVQAASRANLDRARAFGMRAVQDWEGAAAAFARWAEEEPRSGLPRQSYADARYQQKRYAEAADAYEQAGDLGTNPAVTWYNAACCRALLGQKDEALTLLERAIGTGRMTDRAAMRADPDLASLVGDARFERLVGPQAPTP